MNNRKPAYSDDELAIIKEFYPENGSGIAASIIEARFGIVRTGDAIAQTARKIGLTYQGKKRGGFVKGQIPHNKGKKMPLSVREKVAHTFFKKGQRSHNTRPNNDGGISIRLDKRGVPQLFIRLGVGEWEYLSRHAWASFFGPIPPKHCVIFKDGNTLNCSIENLQLISLAENARRNHNPQKAAQKWNNPTDQMVYGCLWKMHGGVLTLEELKTEGILDIHRQQIILKRSISKKNDQ